MVAGNTVTNRESRRDTNAPAPPLAPVSLVLHLLLFCCAPVRKFLPVKSATTELQSAPALYCCIQCSAALLYSTEYSVQLIPKVTRAPSTESSGFRPCTSPRFILCFSVSVISFF